MNTEYINFKEKLTTLIKVSDKLKECFVYLIIGVGAISMGGVGYMAGSRGYAPALIGLGLIFVFVIIHSLATYFSSTSIHNGLKP